MGFAILVARREMGAGGVDTVLFQVLADGVRRYLAEEAEGGAPEGTIRAAVLAAAWRALLRRHEMGSDGRCEGCGRWRRGAGLCSVWQVAVAYFVRRPGGG
jgi:hypothetical protein